ncbi:MAG: S8 family peptidase [Acidobacteriota bacterium]|nr:S8 family peptidase [Acidobacteriota bacterium]
MQTPKAGDDAVVAAAVTRIAEESAGTLPLAETRAAPTASAGPSPDAALAAGSPAPPVGHSFVGFDGEMAKGAIERRGGVEPRPAADGLDWLGSPTAIGDLVAQAAGADRDWSFGWIRLAEDAHATDLARALRGSRAEIVGAAGRLIRARLPGDEAGLRAVSALSEVDGIGTPPPQAKLRAVAQEIAAIPAHEQIPVFVTLMAGDADGRWRRELEDLGAVVGHYEPAILVYAANATQDVLEAVAVADFVMAIEPVGVVEAAHDTAVPAMGVDALRRYQGSPGLFSGVGGAPVPIAVMDTGLNVNHLDISSNRSSVCGANFVYYEPLVDDEDLWIDAGMHGTHVTGTIAGNGTVDPRLAGMAPMVGHIRFAKVLSHRGFGDDISILRGMDFLGRPTACPESGWSPDPVKPLIVNMSLSASARVWEGRGVSERKLDSIVWDRRQLYVVAQSNENVHGFSNYAAAKNSLAVGAVTDGGSLAAFSSHGPTADGRLAPQVVGAGVGVNSTAGDGSRGGYLELSGTSMASPAVAGVAALLMDAVPAHRERPALARARLMASAIKPDPWMEDAAAFPVDNSGGPGVLQTQYGLGKVSARTSVLNNNRAEGWTSGSAVSELADGEYAYHDIRVPEGASRLDLVLTWDEPPTDTLASPVLNDLDLWLDHGGDCETEPCGEYSSQSRVDNVEWIVVRNPAPGTYRAKVAASRVYTDPPRAALAWTTIRGASTPDLEISLDTETVEFEERVDEAELVLTLAADEYVAAGTRLQIDCRRADGSGCPRTRIWYSGRGRYGFVVTVEREDGQVQEVVPYMGDSIEIGELAAGETWKAKVNFLFDLLAEDDTEAVRLYFKASAWNANPVSTSVLARMTGAEEDLGEAATPANDRFADAAPIGGSEGSAALDLIGAQAEPGEPLLSRWGGRPDGSVWYAWTAPSDGMVSFSVTPDAAYGATDTVRVDAYLGDRIAALEPVAAADWGVQFFADSGRDYRIRVSHAGLVAPLQLNWSSGERPANDDFAAAAVLGDADGRVEGTNAGATLEPGEFFGDLAATVWYQWTAPGDGAWAFESRSEDLRVLAFAGTGLSDLRLVSGFAGERAAFPARAGEVYRLAVASPSAEAAGGTY